MPWIYNDNEYLKIFRKIQNWEWWDEPKTMCLFIHLLVMANWKPGTWHGFEYDAGDIITSLPSLSEATGLSIKSIRTSIDNLVGSGEIESMTHDRAGKKMPKNRIISIKNWSSYQSEGSQTAGKGQAEGSQTAGKGQANGSRYKNKRSKEEKNNIYKGPDFSDPDIETAFQNYATYRQRIRKPLTDRATTLLINKLQQLAGDNKELSIRIIDQSIERGWQSFYPIKEDSYGNARPNEEPARTDDDNKDFFDVGPYEGEITDDMSPFRRKQL